MPNKKDIEKLLKKLPETNGLEKIKLLAELCEIHRVNNPQKSIKFGKQALELLTHIKDTKLESQILNVICWCSQCIGEHMTALKYGLRKLEIANEDDIDDDRATAYNGIGIAYWRLAEFDNALDYFMRALRIIEESGNKQRIAIMLNNVGLIFSDMGDNDKALNYYHKVIKIYEKLDNNNTLADSLNNAGTSYKDTGNYKKALNYYKRALKIYEILESKWGISHVLTNIGSIYKEHKEYDMSLDYFFKSLDIEDENRDINARFETILDIALIYSATDCPTKAIEYAKKGFAIAKKLDTKDLIRNCYETFSIIYEKKSNFKKALKYHKKFKELNDKIFTKESREKYNELLICYETEKKEKENENYRLKNIELAKANEKLKIALKEVKKLSGMLPICSSCKKIRDDSGYWKQIEEYISEHSDTQFTHGLCPDCVKKLYPKYVNEDE